VNVVCSHTSTGLVPDWRTPTVAPQVTDGDVLNVPPTQLQSIYVSTR